MKRIQNGLLGSGGRTAAASVALACYLTPFTASALPVTFDFEDGTTQGWTLSETVRVRPGNLVSGTYSVLGIDQSIMFQLLDLTGVRSITMERVYTSKPEDWTWAFDNLTPEFTELLRRTFERTFSWIQISQQRPTGGVSFFLGTGTRIDGTNTWRFDLPEPVYGQWMISILWNEFVCGEDQRKCFAITYEGAIDNITFVAEPRLAFPMTLVGIVLLITQRVRSCPTARRGVL
jgi:hypothetical protein